MEGFLRGKYKMKGVKNGWEQTPRVRYAVLDIEGGDILNLPATQFPLQDVKYTKYYLDGKLRTLTPSSPTQEVKVMYDTETDPATASFIARFDRKMVMVGYLKVHLWVEAEGADHMDLFILAQKLDVHGNPLSEFLVPNQGAMMHDLTERGGPVLRYKGPNGRLRISARHFDC
ncbi:MAG: hypothetical protein LUF85_08735 [Bacteroides sp.]|nr:hypothetical protein [Bacteroides sp.]